MVFDLAPRVLISEHFATELNYFYNTIVSMLGPRVQCCMLFLHSTYYFLVVYPQQGKNHIASPKKEVGTRFARQLSIHWI